MSCEHRRRPVCERARVIEVGRSELKQLLLPLLRDLHLAGSCRSIGGAAEAAALKGDGGRDAVLDGARVATRYLDGRGRMHIGW